MVAVFDDARRRLGGQKRAILSLTLDGETLTPERQKAVSGDSVSAHSLLEIRSLDPLALCLSTLESLGPHMDALDQRLDEGARLVLDGNLAKGGEKLFQAVDGWDILARAVRDVGSLSAIDFNTLQAGPGTVQDLIRKLRKALTTYQMVCDARDMTRVAEMARDELRPILAEWRGMVEAIQVEVKRRSGVPS